MHRGINSSAAGRENAFEVEDRVVIFQGPLPCDVVGVDEYTEDLVNAFHHAVGLGIACGNQLLVDAPFVLHSEFNFSFELASSVQDDLRWTGIAV